MLFAGMGKFKNQVDGPSKSFVVNDAHETRHELSVNIDENDIRSIQEIRKKIPGSTHTNFHLQISLTDLCFSHSRAIQLCA